MANENLLTQPSVPEMIQPVRNVFENIQKQGIKELNKRFVELKKDIKFEQNLCMFEFMYSLTLSKKEREKSTKSVRKLRDEYWKKAMKKADGDEDKAIEIYDKLISL